MTHVALEALTTVDGTRHVASSQSVWQRRIDTSAPLSGFALVPPKALTASGGLSDHQPI
jgi:hypothetical protein